MLTGVASFSSDLQFVLFLKQTFQYQVQIIRQFFFTTGWRLISVLKLKSVKDLIKIFGCVRDLMTFSKGSQSQLLGTNVSKHWLLVLKLVSAKNLFRIKVGVWLCFSRMEQARFQKWLAVAVPIKSYRCILASQCLCYKLFLLYRKKHPKKGVNVRG